MDFIVALNNGKIKFSRFLKVPFHSRTLELFYEYLIKIFLFRSNFKGGFKKDVNT